MEAGPPAETALPLRRRVVQYYGRQLKALAASAVLFAAILALDGSQLGQIPRDGFGSLAEMFATLLGLTFAAFSVLTALLPSVPRSLVRSRTFLMFGQTFVATMWLQLVTLLASGLCYLGFGEGWVSDAGSLVVLGGILSTMFLLVVIHYMFYLFKLVRLELSGNGAPREVL
ncbi:MAG: hypothetical protein L3K00_03165 [Thermoplasmata archaeon]|nr:hypothetical protein [Thermoplasmata archaeon]